MPWYDLMSDRDERLLAEHGFTYREFMLSESDDPTCEDCQDEAVPVSEGGDGIHCDIHES